MFYARKSPYECVHSVRIELAKLIVIGTRITYQDTGDADYIVYENICLCANLYARLYS